MDPEKRPTFSELVNMMSQNLATLAGYLNVCPFTELEAHAREDPDTDTEVKEHKIWQQQILLAFFPVYWLFRIVGNLYELLVTNLVYNNIDLTIYAVSVWM